MLRVLVADDIGSSGIELLEGTANVECNVQTGLSSAELIATIADYDGLIVRSATKVTSEVLGAAARLRVVGRAGVGVDNIDVTVATQLGIIVMNTPQANAIAAAEQTMALMLAATRHTTESHRALSEGRWERSKWVGTEIYHKTLGIIGLGRIGRLVATRAHAFGMDVVAYDPYVSEETALEAGVDLVPIEELFSEADYVTLHASSSPETENLIDSEAIESMKDGVVIVNVARGILIDEAALAAALQSGKVRAAAIDVYRTEPPEGDHPLIGLANVVHTPHLGASTTEAQRNVSVQIADQVIDALHGREIRNAVNLPLETGSELAVPMP